MLHPHPPKKDLLGNTFHFAFEDMFVAAQGLKISNEYINLITFPPTRKIILRISRPMNFFLFDVNVLGFFYSKHIKIEI